MVCVAICSIAQCASPSTHYTFDDLWYLPSSKVSWQDIMTGNTDGFFWWIPLAGLALSVGVVSLLWLIVEGAMRISAHELLGHHVTMKRDSSNFKDVLLQL